LRGRVMDANTTLGVPCLVMQDGLVFIPYETCDFGGGTMLEPGIYVTFTAGEVYTTKVYIPSVTTVKGINKLPEKFLPDGVGAPIDLILGYADGYIYNNTDVSNPSNRTTCDELKQILKSGRQIRVYMEIEDSISYCYPIYCTTYEGVGYILINFGGTEIELHTAEYTPETTTE